MGIVSNGPNPEHACRPPRTGFWNDGVVWQCDHCGRHFRGFYDYGWLWSPCDPEAEAGAPWIRRVDPVVRFAATKAKDGEFKGVRRES